MPTTVVFNIILEYLDSKGFVSFFFSKTRRGISHVSPCPPCGRRRTRVNIAAFCKESGECSERATRKYTNYGTLNCRHNWSPSAVLCATNPSQTYKQACWYCTLFGDFANAVVTSCPYTAFVPGARPLSGHPQEPRWPHAAEQSGGEQQGPPGPPHVRGAESGEGPGGRGVDSIASAPSTSARNPRTLDYCFGHDWSLASAAYDCCAGTTVVRAR